MYTDSGRKTRALCYPAPMTAGTYIVVICACGGLIACFGFIWAIRSGDLSNVDEAKWLVFDDDELEEMRKP